MDRLTPPQLVLLNILVAFVTSIATTIISMALLGDTPLSITQVITNVTERERLVEVQMETIKQDILDEIDLPTPVVAGVSDKREPDLAVLESASARLGVDDLFVVVGSDIRIVHTVPKDISGFFAGDGVYELPLHDLHVLHSMDFSQLQLGQRSPRLGEDVLVYDHQTQRLHKGYVTQVDQEIVWGDGEYTSRHFTVTGCRDMIGAAVLAERDYAVLGVCDGAGGETLSAVYKGMLAEKPVLEKTNESEAESNKTSDTQITG